MLKITIILWLLTLVFGVAIKLIGNTMDVVEKFALLTLNITPARVAIPTILFLLCGIGAVVMTIVTVIYW